MVQAPLYLVTAGYSEIVLAANFSGVNSSYTATNARHLHQSIQRNTWESQGCYSKDSWWCRCHTMVFQSLVRSLAIQRKVEKELERFQEYGLIEPVQFLDWAMPNVPVMKLDRSVHICRDYKVTVHHVIKMDKCPILKIVHVTVQWTAFFEMFNLSLTHQEIELDENSRHFVMINTHKSLFQYNRLPFTSHPPHPFLNT